MADSGPARPEALLGWQRPRAPLPELHHFSCRLTPDWCGERWPQTFPAARKAAWQGRALSRAFSLPGFSSLARESIMALESHIPALGVVQPTLSTPEIANAHNGWAALPPLQCTCQSYQLCFPGIASPPFTCRAPRPRSSNHKIQEEAGVLGGRVSPQGFATEDRKPTVRLPQGLQNLPS